jgi:hypothetical protein
MKMETWLIALLVKPLAAFLVLVVICYPAKMAVARYMSDGKLKRLLLTRIGGR